MKVERYRVNEKHRKNAAKKDCTQWTVTDFHEIRLFADGQINGWTCDNDKTIWSIESVDGQVTVLGYNGNSDAKLAKFIVDHNNEWHGYPISPIRSGDKPPTAILDAWEKKGIISRPERRKINTGKW
ncbi:hypothetical protein [Vibrio tubiashii]|uniref:hypothetical protein n=1 Tax=Vibrio tubiashii TaxID=29498 RepID=UPI00148CAB52|nr:hypothetical protein [Vibrio tubiashii]